jgi:hypothetical protein
MVSFENSGILQNLNRIEAYQLNHVIFIDQRPLFFKALYSFLRFVF